MARDSLKWCRIWRLWGARPSGSGSAVAIRWIQPCSPGWSGRATSGWSLTVGHDAPNLIPVHIITGFLGSGKPTLLRGVLASPAFANTAVVVNEFGEVALDHLLLQRVDPDTVVLQTGCVCCTLRSELGAALRDLYDKRERGRVPPFDRLVIETTGLADPAPLLFTLMADPVLRYHFRLGTIVTTVDAVNGARHLAQHLESVKQVAVADQVVLTKTDLVDRASVDGLRAAVVRYNPTAPLLEAPAESLAFDRLFMGEASDSPDQARAGPGSPPARARVPVAAPDG